MSNRSDIPPDTVSVELSEEGVAVEYLDGRTAFYHGVPTKAEGSVTTAPGKDTHVLITDKTETSGILVYVNDLRTHDEIIEESGVGRVILEDGEEDELFPGVTVTDHQMRVEVTVDYDVTDGRVFVFEEDEMGERGFEIVPSEE
ncbi:DUF5796 family protein [Haloarcula sediminis]|uniref:DUF5796 family protein n=1 Tax=Haloarcula sediminis TaxID=3111777 RepID=UPI002D78C782|nr:DUF5796 family protein [Haloarcula sp. CK38]